MSRRKANNPKESTITSDESETEIEVSKEIKRIRERNLSVRIRSGPGVNFDHVNGEYLGKGIHEIDEVDEGVGSMSGWGHLVNGRGWVALDYVEILP